jgi:hypothetical protein
LEFLEFSSIFFHWCKKRLKYIQWFSSHVFNGPGISISFPQAVAWHSLFVRLPEHPSPPRVAYGACVVITVLACALLLHVLCSFVHVFVAFVLLLFLALAVCLIIFALS